MFSPLCEGKEVEEGGVDMGVDENHTWKFGDDEL